MKAGDTDPRAVQLEEALARQRELVEGIFDTVPLMMTIYEPSTKVLRVNPMFERLTGWSSDALGGTSLMDRCYPDPEYRERARQFMHACKPEWRDFCVTTRNGRQIESSWTNVRLAGDVQLGIGIDLTERKRAEKRLRQSEDALREANRLKDEFLAMLAHELRNPLAPLRSSVEILRDHRIPRDEVDQLLGVVDRQLDVMVRLVNDLLDVARITTGKIELEHGEVELSVVVQKAVETCQPLFHSNGQQVFVEHDPGSQLVVDGDPMRLEQVFANLLHNAAKFTPPGGHVMVDTGREADQATVRVRDNGMGMPSDVLPLVFDMFFQAHRSVDRAHRGLGIGLSLVKRLVELHGGRVEASSAGPGRGSEFVVRLPLLAALPERKPVPAGEPGMAASGPSATPPEPRRRILVVDDNTDAAATLSRWLTARGHDVLVAHDGPSGIDLAQTRKPDTIVLDLGMPGMSGYSVARQIRANPDLRDVLLIALTGWDQMQAPRRSAQVHFDHHLVKPVDPAVLRDLLARPNPRRAR